ncbi:MAG: type 2 isopentenyl-diphosphate Delta-isomerase [Balneolaceae bacterium]|nr:MAG: type 2 isopentenyl-diphosphate Delta-isomerase [Balneolaceae bacterium]
MDISRRKKDHVDLTVAGLAGYRKSAGLESVELLHNALPEVNLNDISLDATLLGRTFSYPLFVSSMTGGYDRATEYNAVLAAFCEEHNLPMGVGSQRAMLEQPALVDSFSIVRKHAPTAFIAGNIGGAQLIGGLPRSQVDILTGSIGADAIIVHLNPLQELLQPEGDVNFKGVLDGIAALVDMSDVPVIVKETGAGISAAVAGRLLDAGVTVIDVAGAGGTSWARVESLRTDTESVFDDWGIPTVDCLLQMRSLRSRNFGLIASGGIRSGLDIVKSSALGADFSASAQPVMKALAENGREGLVRLLEKWKSESRIALCLIGCKSFDEAGIRHIRTTIDTI